MNKKTCDLCGEEIVARRFGVTSLFSAWWYRITSFYWTTELPFLHRTNVEICDRCFDDFKEFIQRKQICFKKQRKKLDEQKDLLQNN